MEKTAHGYVIFFFCGGGGGGGGCGRWFKLVTNLKETKKQSLRYIIHLYCLAEQAGFYSNMVECSPLDGRVQILSLAGAC